MWQTPVLDRDNFELETVFASASAVLGLLLRASTPVFKFSLVHLSIPSTEVLKGL